MRDFALYGETTGETDEFGLPVRCDWAADYRGAATVVYGHTPVPEPEWLNNTINIDTGCVFGGRLTALRWPERELVSVPAARDLLRAGAAVPAAEPAPRDAQQRARSCSTSTTSPASASSRRGSRGTVTIREENAAARARGHEPLRDRPALARLPAADDGADRDLAARRTLLEHPAEAFAEYRARGRRRRSSARRSTWARARSSSSAATRTSRATRFGVDGGETGVVYTRTGRPFFDDAEPRRLLDRRPRRGRRAPACGTSSDTDWLVLDCELLPWSAKAHGADPAPVRRRRRGRARPALAATRRRRSRRAAARGLDVGALLERQTRDRAERVDRYVDAYRRYGWPVDGVDDLRLAPFHVLAAETGVFVDRDHAWHLERCDALVAADPDWIRRTDRRVVDVTDADEPRPRPPPGGRS